ncbi:16S rRNA (uracil(1498)-N(3))-methyltransferase [Kangiella sp. HZ709]|uniref:16S rRNA (uracil(1498)-N(3))-methyltransferase n=1 Tax=Kangiella sp. HZ709 TaxID=2666328 RepID=UPI0012B12AC0|nr:16S rRNA (uracil(1498)-N(3))-methyltransferase [Kangiella sp. HZ709]MRX28123.1 16S rRNA (uracil(1498)-N(3))-methyltransferase [Kangiella sp. HZ709]
MRLNRIYQNQPLLINSIVALDKSASIHLSKVLRIAIDSRIELFNGNGHRYQAEIVSIERNQVSARVLSEHSVNNESPLNIHLFQAVSRGDKMDLTVQKSVELGVKEFTPIISERCGVKLDQKRWQKKLEHWQKVIISACEQSGRDVVPVINPVLNWDEAIKKINNCFFLDPHTNITLADIKKPNLQQKIQLWIGPEGGFSDSEVAEIESSGTTPVSLGPRILRTETAALATVSALNTLWGDFIQTNTKKS